MARLRGDLPHPLLPLVTDDRNNCDLATEAQYDFENEMATFHPLRQTAAQAPHSGLLPQIEELTRQKSKKPNENNENTHRERCGGRSHGRVAPGPRLCSQRTHSSRSLSPDPGGQGHPRLQRTKRLQRTRRLQD